MKVSAMFVGIQKWNQFAFRLYNVVGEHVLANSTVSVSTLVKERIDVPDLSAGEIINELWNEYQFLMEVSSDDCN